LRARLIQLRKQQSELVNPIPELMVMKELDQPRLTYFLNRGAYDQRGEQVQPDTPQSLLTFSDNLPKNRFGLARWLTDPAHPLTARVAVNRYWRMLFGSGLVDPPNDFGSQGAAPSHPELLDWLARRYIESGWNTKAILRLMVTSSTYRQSSKTDPSLRKLDPTNRMLARGPKHRLSAEMIRDNALAASGLLVERFGGKPVHPYQPPGLWKEIEDFGAYEQDKGEGLYRRSVYTIWKRTSPPPSMTAFDAPTRSVCTVNRQRTGTPLQALVLMNDVQFVEAARLLAEQAIRNGGSQLEDQIRYAFRLATSRLPNQAELNTLVALYQAQTDSFMKKPDDARQFLAVGDHPIDGRINPIQLAALTTVATTLLNLDETITKR
jgi:hypothetical protein